MKAKVKKIIVLPLFPQYASATNGSVIDRVMEIARGWQIIPEISFINNFVEHPLFLQAWAELGQEMMAKQDYDIFLFSYHGTSRASDSKRFRGRLLPIGRAAVINMGRKNQFCLPGSMLPHYQTAGSQTWLT